MSDVAGIHAREYDYLERYVQVGAASGRVISVSFPRTPDANATDDHELLDRIAAYFEGECEDFRNVEVGLTVPTAHRSVLEACHSIPFGEQVTVERLCAMAGLDADDEGAHDAARDALAANPVPLVLPDHRVRDGPGGAPPAVERALRALEGL